MRRFVLIAMLMLTTPLLAEGRRVFVLHSGVHILLSPGDKNFAAKKLKRDLAARGVSEADMIVMDCPYPEASVTDPLPAEGVRIFFESMNPKSEVSQSAYLRLHETLSRHKVTKDDRIVWIGYSAGGQMGLTMAHLAHRVDEFPELRKQTAPYRFEMVITLGTPLGSNHAPAGVAVRQYFSYKDQMVRSLGVGPTAALLGAPAGICFYSPNLGEHCIARRFEEVEHPDWIWEPRVLDRLVRELSQPHPLWLEASGLSCGSQMRALMCRVLADKTRVCLEDPPGD